MRLDIGRRYANKRVPSVLVDAYAMFTTIGLNAVFGFVYWVIAAQVHDVATFGTSAAIISATQLLASFGLVNLPATALRFLPIAGRRASGELAKAYAIAVGVSSLLSALFVVICFTDRLGRTGSSIISSPVTVVAFFAAVAVWAIFYLQDVALIAGGASHWLPVENSIFGALKIVLLLLFRDHGVAGMVVSWFLPAALALVPVNAYLFRKVLTHGVFAASDSGYERRDVRRFLTVGIVGSSANAAMATAMPLVVGAVTEERTVAYFVAAWTIGAMAENALNGFSNALLVAGARAPTEVRALVMTSLRHLAPLALLAATALFLLSPVVLSFYGSGYSDAATWLMRWFALGLLVRTVRAVATTVAYLRHEVVAASAGEAATAISVVAGIAIATPHWGLAGAGVAYLLANVIGLAVIAPTILHRPGKTERQHL